jgi:hypothetical protein
MKMQVIVKNLNKASIAAAQSLELTVMPNSKVHEVQERIASMTNTTSFSDQKMLFKGNVLDSNRSLSTCGIVEGDLLEFVFQPSEQTFVKQLTELLGTRAVSIEELGLLYIHRHGMSLGEMLEALGFDSAKVQSFLEGQKCFVFDGGLVKFFEAQEKTPGGIIEVSAIVEVHVGGKVSSVISDDEVEQIPLRFEACQSIAKAKKAIAAAELIPFPDQELFLKDKKLEDALSLREAGVTDGACLVLSVHASEASLASQLEGLLREHRALSPSDLSLHYCNRFGTPVVQALRILGLHGDIRRFLQGHPRFSLSGGSVTLADEPQVGNFLEAVISLLSVSCFLNIDSIDKGFQSPSGEALATIFVRSLPPASNGSMPKSLCNAVASSLEASSEDAVAIDRAFVDGDLIHVQKQGETVCLRLAAACS